MAAIWKKLGLNRVRTNTIAVTTVVWSLIVFAVLVWQAILYRGLVANIGEWQFATFRKYFPLGTIVVLFALLTGPLHLLLLRRIRRRSRMAARFGTGNAVTLERARFWRTWLTISTAVLVAASLAVIGDALTIGSAGDKVLMVSAGAADASDPGEGPRRLNGLALQDRIAVYTENYVVARRVFAVAPVVGTNANGKTFTYFAQIDPDRTQPGPPARFEQTGYLRHEKLAGALRSLYAHAGFEVTQPAWILYRDVAAARWTHLRIAGVIALFAILLGLLALRQTRKLSKLREMAK